MTRPSIDQTTPEPAPRCPSPTRTVEACRRSASCAKPGSALSILRPLLDRDRKFARFAGAYEAQRQCFPDAAVSERALHVVGIFERLRTEVHEHVTDHDAGLFRRP